MLLNFDDWFSFAPFLTKPMIVAQDLINFLIGIVFIGLNLDNTEG